MYRIGHMGYIKTLERLMTTFLRSISGNEFFESISINMFSGIESSLFDKNYTYSVLKARGLHA